MKYWTELRPDWKDAPMSYWVHRELDSAAWRDAHAFDPPSPRPIGRSGFVFLCVDVSRETLVFSSPQQLQTFISIMSAHPLPSSRRLSALRGTGAGPNSHWLSRLPAKLKSPKVRGQLVKGLSEISADLFQRPNKLLKQRHAVKRRAA